MLADTLELTEPVLDRNTTTSPDDIPRHRAQHRLDGLRNALTAAGTELPPQLQASCPHNLDAARETTTSLITLHKPPTAVFASHDLLTAGVLQATADAGLHVPANLAVIGYDDGPLAAALDLTTIRQPLRDTGRTALQLLQQRLQNTRPPPCT